MKQTTLTEKRFFEWYKDDVSVTLRKRFVNSSGGVSPKHLMHIITKDQALGREQKGST